MKRYLLKAVRARITLASLAIGIVALTSCCCPEFMRHCCQKPVCGQPKQTCEATQSEGRTPGCEPSSLSVARVRRPYPNPLPLVPMVQEGFYSCWATSAEMIMYFHGLHVPQCMQASPANYQCWCCVGWHVREECDRASIPDFQRWGFSATLRRPQPLSWEEATTEIGAGRPFAFARTEITESETMGHMMVAIGYKQPRGPESRMLVCLNPRALTYAHEEDVMFQDYQGVNASPTGGGTGLMNPPIVPPPGTPPSNPLPVFRHEMTYSGILWQGSTQ